MSVDVLSENLHEIEATGKDLIHAYNFSDNKGKYGTQDLRKSGLASLPWCRCITTVYNYFVVTNFFWMFVEGCYLHTAIVMTYSTDKLRKWVFLFIGWCIPCPIIIAWAIGKLYYENEQCWFGKEPGKYIDYIYQGPVILVLLINFVFLFNIVRILMTKLRASTTSETIQYRKAVKATLVLLPLLGITYMLFFVNPGEDDISQIVFIYFNSFLQSFQDICIELAGMAQDLRMALPFWGGSWELQIDFSTTLLGFFVSVFYCFLNGENSWKIAGASLEKLLEKKARLQIVDR
ncbi:UNVERIFIED_CONTAM: hypothetical protein H355_007673 [Colinus virginianus]|nr:hypothetical protein H355_007673 [Colinus virginianus]